MLHLTSGSALILEAGLALFCLLDALLAPEAAVRWLPRWAWALALLTFPVCGCILWIVAGRPWRSQVRTPPSVLQAPTGPGVTAGTGTSDTSDTSDTADTELVAQLWAVHEEHERTLTAWEADLRRREEALRSRGAA